VKPDASDQDVAGLAAGGGGQRPGVVRAVEEIGETDRTDYFATSPCSPGGWVLHAGPNFKGTVRPSSAAMAILASLGVEAQAARVA